MSGVRQSDESDGIRLTMDERDQVVRAGYRVTSFTDQMVAAVERIIEARLRSAVGDLIPGLRAEAERLRSIDVHSVALWMDNEADRLALVTPPGDPT